MLKNICKLNILEIKWRSSLSASIRTTISGSFEKPYVKSYSIYYEIIYAQMAYAYILSNMAIKKVTNDGSEEALNAAINDLCRGNNEFLFNILFIILSCRNISNTFNNLFKHLVSSRWTTRNDI